MYLGHLRSCHLQARGLKILLSVSTAFQRFTDLRSLLVRRTYEPFEGADIAGVQARSQCSGEGDTELGLEGGYERAVAKKFYPLPGVDQGTISKLSLETLICPDIFGRSPSVVECARQFWTSIMLGPRGWSRKVDCSGYESMGVSGNVEDSRGHAERCNRMVA